MTTNETVTQGSASPILIIVVSAGTTDDDFYRLRVRLNMANTSGTLINYIVLEEQSPETDKGMTIKQAQMLPFTDQLVHSVFTAGNGSTAFASALELAFKLGPCFSSLTLPLDASKIVPKRVEQIINGLLKANADTVNKDNANNDDSE